jgi:lysophospholipase L1-like esterase
MVRSRMLNAGTAILVAAGALIAMVVFAVPAAATVQYVALGDSYASGVGSRSYYADSGSCYRSPYAYAVADAARIGAVLTFSACSGATTSSVQSGQLGGLNSGTTWVTVQVGGNDAGFSSVITTCAEPSWLGNCSAAVANAQNIIRNTLPGRLDTLYNNIHARAPSAGVVVVGYPRLFNGEDCNAGTFFSPNDEALLNQTADLMDSTLAGRASAHGFAFVNPESAFVGHAVCDSVEWVNGLSNPVMESYHPNRSGQAAYANLVDDDL